MPTKDERLAAHSALHVLGWPRGPLPRNALSRIDTVNLPATIIPGAMFQRPHQTIKTVRIDEGKVRHCEGQQVIRRRLHAATQSG
jgi:hypothetical protein